MFNQDFYPTPPDLIRKLLVGVTRSKVRRILEPSAGKGDICDHIKQSWATSYSRPPRISVVEIEPELQSILTDKGYSLVHDDFLTYRTHQCYDLIIANFPFSDGAKHLRHALGMIEANGGTIAAIVNAETIANPFTIERRELVAKLEELGATWEFMDGEFVKAERRTRVRIAIVRCTAPTPQGPSLIFDNLKKSMAADAPEVAASAIVERSFIKQAVASFDMENRVTRRLVEEYFTIMPYLKDRIVKEGDSDYSDHVLHLRCKDMKAAGAEIGEFLGATIEAIRHKYWASLLNDNRFRSKYTTNIQQTLQKKLEALKDYDFTEFNIRQLERELSVKIASGIEDSIYELFETFSNKWAFFDGSRNIHLYNGWKTNKAHKINPKVIIPINGFNTGYSGTTAVDYYLREKLHDLVKAFQYLAGEQADAKQIVGDSIDGAASRGDYRNVDLRYFEASFFKKGTCHIKFTNPILLDRLNIFGSRKKGWLPPAYGKVAYDDLDAESQSVVDEFQGKEAYEAVVSDPSKFIIQIKGPALLG